MRVIKNINNNVSLCLTDSGVEVIAFGKGLGFKRPPYEIELSQIDRTFYDVDQMYIQMINEIPEQILDISIRVMDYARTLIDSPISSNVVFTLADHIHFAIERHRKHMEIKLPILYDVKSLMQKEVMIGYRALELIRRELKVRLPEEEAACIALHIANAEGAVKTDREENDEAIIGRVVEIIEDFFDISIDRSGFTYSRFAMHMRYLIRRGRSNTLLQGEDMALLETLSESLEEVEKCVQQIVEYLNRVLDCRLTPEEKMYLIIYTNRICMREEER